MFLLSSVKFTHYLNIKHEQNCYHEQYVNFIDVLKLRNNVTTVKLSRNIDHVMVSGWDVMCVCSRSEHHIIRLTRDVSLYREILQFNSINPESS